MGKWIISVSLIVLVVAFLLFVLPAISLRDGGLPRRFVDTENHKQIGVACALFASDHDGNYPRSFAELGKYVGTHTELFVSCRNSHTATNSLDNVQDWTDFVYLPGCTTASPPQRVVAFLPPGHYEEKTGAAILFADGHVEWQRLRELTRTLNKSPNTASHGTALPRRP